jgi:hypothetical protein
MSLWSNHDVVNHHFRRYTKKQLLELFAAHSGQLKKVTYFNFFLFIPIYLVRSLQRMLRAGKQGELKPDNDMVESRFINSLLHSIFSFERKLLKRLNFPFGVSLLLIWERHG